MVDNEFNQFASFSYSECLQQIFSFKLLTENHISAQVKNHQQATESQCCHLFAVHRTNNHHTVGEDGFILLHHLKLVHFKQLHLLLSSTHTFFFGISQMIQSIALLCSHMAEQLTDPERSLGGWWNIQQLPSFCLSLKEMIKSGLLSPSAIPHKSVGKEHLPNELSTHRDSKATRGKYRMRQIYCTNCISSEKLVTETSCFRTKANFPVMN